MRKSWTDQIFGYFKDYFNEIDSYVLRFRQVVTVYHCAASPVYLTVKISYISFLLYRMFCVPNDIIRVTLEYESFEMLYVMSRTTL